MVYVLNIKRVCYWLKQIFKSLEEELIAKDKLKNIQQTISVIAYSTEFQI